MKTTIALSLAALALAGTASASPDLAIGVKAGVQGLTIQARPRVSEQLFARVSASILNASGELEGENGSLSYDASFKSRSLGTLVDWHPWGSFRFTAGLHFTDTTAEGSARCDELFCSVGDSTFTPIQLGTLEIDYDAGSHAALFAVGVTTNRNQAGWGFDAEAGLLWRPNVNVELSSRGGTCQIDPICQAELEEDERTFEEKLEFVPVVNVGLMYSF